MKDLNRLALIKYLVNIKDDKEKMDILTENDNSIVKYQNSESSQASFKSLSIASEPENVSDKEIEENFKMLLKQKRYGKFIDASIVAHLEYFNNTLN